MASIPNRSPPSHEENSSHRQLEESVCASYHPPGMSPPLSNLEPALPSIRQFVRNPADHSLLRDHHGNPVTVDRILATKPLQNELATRPGPGNRKLLYLPGDVATRTLNEIFGYHGWNLDILSVQLVDKQERNQKFHVAYTAHVRMSIIDHQPNQKDDANSFTSSNTNSNSTKVLCYREDYGAGDAVDRQLATALAHALKASITDGIKRAARHFGDKLGNSLYQGSFSMQKAPKTLQAALDLYDKERAQAKFGSIQKNNNSNNNNNNTNNNAHDQRQQTQKQTHANATAARPSIPQQTFTATETPRQPPRPSSLPSVTPAPGPMAPPPVAPSRSMQPSTETPQPPRPSPSPLPSVAPGPMAPPPPAAAPAPPSRFLASRVSLENIPPPPKASEALANSALFRPESSHGVRKQPHPAAVAIAAASTLQQQTAAKRPKPNPYG